MRARRFLLPVVVVVACVAAAPNARATPAFPEAVRGHLGLEFTPLCQLCHTDGGNIGTATQPFAVSMIARGLAPFDVESLEAALDAMEEEGVDSDGDGSPDVTELRNGRDPNLADGLEPPQLQYGFGCATAPPPDAVFACAALVGLARVRTAARRRRAIRSVRSEAY